MTERRARNLVRGVALIGIVVSSIGTAVSIQDRNVGCAALNASFLVFDLWVGFGLMRVRAA